MIFYISDGRLGNQLFQYAFLNSLAKNNEKVIVINMRDFNQSVDYNKKRFKTINPNKYGILLFKKLIKPIIYHFFVRFKFVGYVKQRRKNITALPSFEKHKGYFPITLVESNFFQSEEFFNSESVDFVIKTIYINRARDFLANIPEGYTKVFVHVRHGDYLCESYLDKKGINLPKSYFDSAIFKIKQELQNPYFVFLSDDPDYVKYAFEKINNKIISNNDMGTDLAIMSLCNYGIVSNSSFSWWGAYLMDSREKVIFPKYWYGWKSKVESHIGIQPSWGTVIDV